MLIPDLAVFNRLPVPTQIGIVLTEGVFLCNRLGEDGSYLNLYHLSNFFAELSYDADRNTMYACRTFQGKSQLQAYSQLVKLPDL